MVKRDAIALSECGKQTGSDLRCVRGHEARLCAGISHPDCPDARMAPVRCLNPAPHHELPPVLRFLFGRDWIVDRMPSDTMRPKDRLIVDATPSCRYPRLSLLKQRQGVDTGMRRHDGVGTTDGSIISSPGISGVSAGPRRPGCSPDPPRRARRPADYPVRVSPAPG